MQPYPNFALATFLLQPHFLSLHFLWQELSPFGYSFAACSPAAAALARQWHFLSLPLLRRKLLFLSLFALLSAAAISFAAFSSSAAAFSSSAAAFSLAFCCFFYCSSCFFFRCFVVGSSFFSRFSVLFLRQQQLHRHCRCFFSFSSSTIFFRSF